MDGHTLARMFSVAAAALGVPRLVGAAGRIRRHELDAAFLYTNEPRFAR